MSAPLLSVSISVGYPEKPRALENVAFDIEEGEIFGLSGPSGAGKSTVALAILRLLEMRGGRVRGSILFGGRDLMACRERDLRRIRGCEIALVLQSPLAALNPALRLETQIREAWRAHSAVPWAEAKPPGAGRVRGKPSGRARRTGSGRATRPPRISSRRRIRIPVVVWCQQTTANGWRS